jgi:hypothetical protein
MILGLPWRAPESFPLLPTSDDPRLQSGAWMANGVSGDFLRKEQELWNRLPRRVFCFTEARPLAFVGRLLL